MSDLIGLRPLVHHIRTQSGREFLEAILRRNEPRGYRNALNRLGQIHDNPNVDFRIRIYDPLMDKAQGLVASYGGDFEGVRKEIEGQRYQDRVALLVREGLDAIAPSLLDIASAGRAPFPLGLVLAAVRSLGPVGRGIEWRMSDDERRVRITFHMLLDQLALDLGGGQYNSLVDGFLEHEAERQFLWDEQLAKIPSQQIQGVFPHSQQDYDASQSDVAGARSVPDFDHDHRSAFDQAEDEPDIAFPPEVIHRSNVHQVEDEPDMIFPPDTVHRSDFGQADDEPAIAFDPEASVPPIDEPDLAFDPSVITSDSDEPPISFDLDDIDLSDIDEDDWTDWDDDPLDHFGP